MDLAQRTTRRLLVVVAAVVVVTVAGLIVLWPSADELPAVPDAPEALLDGTIGSVELYETEPDEIAGLSGEAARIEVELTSGPDAGETVLIDTPTDGYPTFRVGDRVKLSSSELSPGVEEFYIVDFQRTPALMLLAALFIGLVLVVGRWHGARSLLGLGLSLLIVTQFIVPGILSGQRPALIALFGALAVMLVTLYLAHGVNEMTTVAVIGTAAALAVTIGFGMLFIERAKLTGFSSEEANLARFAVEGLDLQGLVLAGLIIAALGVLDDVTVSQASTVFALHDADPRQPFGQLFGRAMKVGRDHIASTVNTLFLAYAGASLALLVVFSTGGLAVGEVVNAEILAEEIVKTLVGSLGLVSAVPFTTALAATVAVRRPLGAPPLAGAHLHRHGGHGPGEAASAHPAGPSTPRPDAASPDDPDLSDEDRAHRSWINYLREGSQGGDVPPAPERDQDPQDDR
ncbi:MAG: YibE/F family protein [Actinobacteria bacterium]|nr:YibE/F family protein [Actinomycetota bacterium]